MSSSTAATDNNKEKPPDWRRQHKKNLSKRRAHLDEASRARADRLAKECRVHLLRAVGDCIARFSRRNTSDKMGILLSGGVDSTAILEACRMLNAPLEAAVTVCIVGDDTQDTIPEDERYAREAIKLYNEGRDQKLPHHVVRVSPSRLVEEHSEPVIQTLAVWGYMETRNSLIMSAAFGECARLGITDVLLGDNADEILGGSYDWYFDPKYASQPEEWIAKRNATADLPFATNKIADHPVNNLWCHQPFRNKSMMIDWATKSTTRTDCIDVHHSCRLQRNWGGPFKANGKCGKLPLREAFCTVASWRTMDWIFKGSGAADGGGLVEYYETLYSNGDFELEQARYLLEEGVRLQSKEHLHNIRVYERVFGGLRHPTKSRYAEGDPRGCVSCRFDHEDEDFCHLCDEYPAQPKSAAEASVEEDEEEARRRLIEDPLPEMPVLPITSQSTLRACRAMTTTPRDVFVCSYPKSGTTWTQNIVVRLLWELSHHHSSNKEELTPQLPDDWHLSQSAPFYEVDRYWRQAAGSEENGIKERLPAETPILARTTTSGDSSNSNTVEYRVFNTHLLPHQLPIKARCIYVVRDPLDVMISFYHHLSNQAVEDGGYTGSFEEFFEGFLDGTIVYGKWQDHIEAWLGNRSVVEGEDTFLLLHYDGMKKDLYGETKRLVRFLSSGSGGDISNDDGYLDEIVARVVPHCTFDAMKRERQRYTPRTVAWKTDPETGKPFAFVRNGNVGDGRRVLSTEKETTTSTLVDRWRNKDNPIARARWTKAGVDPAFIEKYLQAWDETE